MSGSEGGKRLFVEGVKPPGGSYARKKRGKQVKCVSRPDQRLTNVAWKKKAGKEKEKNELAISLLTTRAGKM